MKIEKLNSIVMVLFFDLLVACNIGFVKKNKIESIKKEAAKKGVLFAAFKDHKTGSRVMDG